MEGIPQESAKIKSFWIPAFGDGDIDDEENDNLEGDEQEAEDDWRIAFREDHTGENERVSNQQGKSERNHQLSTSRALRSARSHRSQFTACWFALLPHLKGSEAASMRVLNVLQHGVMPNLTKPVRLHDWVAGCVDFGERSNTQPKFFAHSGEC
jgi:U3 small nucleolar RNA-associated protein 19